MSTSSEELSSELSSDDYESSEVISSDEQKSGEKDATKNCKRELTNKTTSFDLTEGQSTTISTSEIDLHNAICSCTSCSAKRKSVITKDTVYMIEFEIKHINSDEFAKELLKRCHENVIEGYVIYSPDRTQAKGILEGATKNLNVVKNWIQLNKDDFVAEPLEINIYLSWFLIATNPTKFKFNEVKALPKAKKQSNDNSTNFRSV